jgi:hypothetical protein
MPETFPLSGLGAQGLLTALKRRPVGPILRDAAAARHTSDVHVDQQLQCNPAIGDCDPNVPRTYVHLPEARLNGAVVDEYTSPPGAHEAMVVAFGLESGSCLVCFLLSNLAVSAIDYYTCRKVFGSVRFYFIQSIMEHRANSIFAHLGVYGTPL